MARDVKDWIVEEPWFLVEEVEEYDEEVTGVSSSERLGEVVSTQKTNSYDGKAVHPMVELRNTESGEVYEFDSVDEAEECVWELEDEEGVVLVDPNRVDHMEVEFTDENSGDVWLGVYEESY